MKHSILKKKYLPREIKLLKHVIHLVESYYHTETLTILRGMLKDRQVLLRVITKSEKKKGVIKNEG